MMFNIDSSAYRPFVYHLWRNICSDPLPIFYLGCLFIELQRSLHILDILLYPLYDW